MLKRFLTLYTFVAVLGIATNASDRTDAEMQSIAGRQLFGSGTRGMVPAAKDLTLELKNDNLSIYSAEGYGFVVVCRDDTFPAMLGSSSTAIDMNNLPEGFAWWLKEVSRSLQERRENGNWYTRTRSDISVEPFLTTKWSQENPYNLKCPKIATDYCPVGCVATAAAQIMKYYNYPAQAQGTVKYQKNGIPKTKDINSVYDWTNMKKTYAKTQNALTTETEAVATLMADVGAASGMNYTGNYGSATLYDCANGLVNVFQYDSLSLSMHYRLFYDDVEWRGLVYSELSNRRPILYAGSPNSEEESAGHAFVFHGLNAEGMVYVNWGWNGTCDGYYDIDVLQPGKEAVQKGDYSANGQMLIGFNPTNTPSEDVEERSVWITDTVSYFSIDRDSLILNARGIYNYNYRSFRGRLLVALENVNGVADDSYNYIFYDTEAEGRTPVQSFYGFVLNDEDKRKYGQEVICPLKDDEIKPGTYIVTLASQASHESEMSPMRYYKGVTCQAKLVKGADGSVELTDIIPTVIENVKTKAVRGSSKIYDLHGRYFGTDASQLGKGIYIIDGKLAVR